MEFLWNLMDFEWKGIVRLLYGRVYLFFGGRVMGYIAKLIQGCSR